MATLTDMHSHCGHRERDFDPKLKAVPRARSPLVWQWAMGFAVMVLHTLSTIHRGLRASWLLNAALEWLVMLVVGSQL